MSDVRVNFVAIFICSGSFALAAEKDWEKSAAKLITPAAERSIDRGLKWLAGAQHEDGGFGTKEFRGNAAVCALAGMAMMSGGSTPGRGPYGTQVDRCLAYVLRCANPSGLIAGPDSLAPMYGHGFATMFLAECYGMSPRADLRETLAKAVAIIVNSQNAEGGWRYQPVRDDADISVTVCQVMALRAAHNAGLFVPSQTVDRAIDYIKRCQNPDGGFMYMLSGGKSDKSEFPRSAAAVAALYSAGVHQGPNIDKGLDYLMQFIPAEQVPRRESYYFYGQYYAAQAAWQADPERFTHWYPAVRDELIAQQRDDGSWLDPVGGNHCGAAMACIVLQMPNNVLPIFQR
jgi:hypothetical protein